MQQAEAGNQIRPNAEKQGFCYQITLLSTQKDETAVQHYIFNRMCQTPYQDYFCETKQNCKHFYSFLESVNLLAAASKARGPADSDSLGVAWSDGRRAPADGHGARPSRVAETRGRDVRASGRGAGPRPALAPARLLMERK